MKKLLKAMLLATILSLTLVSTAFASSINGVIIGTDNGDSTEAGGVAKKVGASYVRTGYLIYATDSSGNLLGNRVVFATSFSNQFPHNPDSAKDYEYDLTTRFGQVFTDMTFGVAWNAAPFSSTGASNRILIDDWMKSPYGNCQTGLAWVLKNYLGFNDDQLKAFGEKDSGQYLQLEPVMWCGVFSGAKSETYTGTVFCGTAKTWAEHHPESYSSFVGKYTNQNLPNSLIYKYDVCGIVRPADVDGKHSADALKTQTNGYGIS